MLKLVLRVFSFSGMPVADRPLGTRVREYFVTTRTVPWTSYRKAFRVCKPRRVYFILFNFDSWAIRGILETWSCQSTKVREKKLKKKKRNFVSHFLSCFYSNYCELTKQFLNMNQCDTNEGRLVFYSPKTDARMILWCAREKNAQNICLRIVPSTNYGLTEAWLEIDTERRIFHKCFPFMKGFSPLSYLEFFLEILRKIIITPENTAI